MRRKNLRLSVAVLALGVVLFPLSYWPNIHLGNARIGDPFELIGTAFLVTGASMFAFFIIGRSYAVYMFMGGSALLVFARFLDMAEEFVPQTTFLVGREWPAHHSLMRISEGMGYVAILATSLALLYELARLRKKAEDEHDRYRVLYEASVFLARVADMSPEAVIGCDRNGVLRTWNRGAESVFAYTPAEAVGMELPRLIMEIAGDPVNPAFVETVVASGARQDVEGVAQAKDGTLFRVSVSFSPVEDDRGQPVGVSIVVRDIESEKRREAELIAARNILAGAMQNADIGLFIIGLDERFIEFNSRMEDLTGMKRKSVPLFRELAASLSDKSDKFVHAITQSVFREGRTADFRHIEICRRDGSRRVCNIAVAPVRDEEGHVVAAGGVAVDVTERETLQAKLLESQKIESIGRLAGGIAHDFNNILGGVLGYASFISQKIGEDSPIRRYVQAIEESAVRASELTHQLLAFAKGGERRLQTLQLNEVAQETLRLLASSFGPNIQVVFDPDEDLDPIDADRGQMQQAIMNLCINSRDAIKDAGDIRITTSNVRVDEPLRRELNLSASGDYVRIAVEDSGAGMPPEVTQRMFEPFFSTKELGHGYGLGLSVVYGIVEAHKGAISVNSAVGEGTRIEMYLPASGHQAVAAPHTVHGTFDARGGTETILVVDDEKLIRTLVNDILHAAGYTVISAASGEEALELFRNRPDNIDMVIMDLVMPGMGGVRALTSLREIAPELRCIVSSGYSTEHVEEGELAGTLTRFVAKPYQASALVAMVRELLDAEPTHAEPSA